MVRMSVDRVGQAVVAHVCHDKQVRAADGLLENAFSLPASEPGTAAVYEIIFGTIIYIQGGF